MEIEVFPVVDSKLSLDNALAVLKQGNRSAIVIQEGEFYSLVEAPDIVIGAAEGAAPHLSRLQGLLKLNVLPLSTITAGLLDFNNPDVVGELERYLDTSGSRFVILAATPSRALLASRSELDMMPLQASPRDCYCKSDRKPVFPGVHYGNCPHDSNHVGTVRCR